MLFRSLLIALLLLCFSINEMLGNEPKVLIKTFPVSCNKGSNGMITIQITDISQVYTAQIYKYSPTGKPIEPKQINDITQFAVTGLTAGKYFTEIKGSKGFSFTQSIEVSQPEKLGTGKITVAKKLSAPEASDAILKAAPTGGTEPYTFLWNIGEKSEHSQIIKNVAQGTYTCIINDANNCGPVKASILFNKYVLPNIVEE